jgi:hypothetical protein
LTENGFEAKIQPALGKPKVIFYSPVGSGKFMKSDGNLEKNR